MPDSLTLTALHPSGFEVCLQVPSLDALEPTIADLLQRGYRPTSGASDGWQRTPEGHPLCPKHRVPMRPRLKQGDEWYSHSVTNRTTGEIVYCKGYKSPSSPGWEIDEAHP